MQRMLYDVLNQFIHIVAKCLVSRKEVNYLSKSKKKQNTDAKLPTEKETTTSMADENLQAVYFLIQFNLESPSFGA